MFECLSYVPPTSTSVSLFDCVYTTRSQKRKEKKGIFDCRFLALTSCGIVFTVDFVPAFDLDLPPFSGHGDAEGLCLDLGREEKQLGTE